MDSNLVKFEKFMLSSLVVGLVMAALQSKSLTTDFATAIGIAIFQVVILLVILGLVLLISRKNSKIAKFIWLVLYVAGLPIYIPVLGTLLSGSAIGILSVIQLILQCIAMYYLFFKKSNLENNKSDPSINL
jgi:hypothetical protein